MSQALQTTKSRIAPILAIGVVLTFVAGAIGNWRTIVDFVRPPVEVFSAPPDQREDELVWELSMAAPIPLRWEVEVGDNQGVLRQAGDKYMTFSLGSLQNVDVDSLPEAWESETNNPIIRDKEVDVLMPVGGELTTSTAKGFLFEYDASDGSDRKRLEMVAHHNGKAIFARCAIDKRALEAYRSGCMELLDNITLLPQGAWCHSVVATT